MKNTLHVVNHPHGKIYMKQYFEKHGINDDILMLHANFVYAPLFKDTSKETLNKRSQRLNELLLVYDMTAIPDVMFYDFNKEIENFINYDFNRYERVVVWHGDTVEEQILLYLTCSLVKVDMYDVDVTFVKNKYSNRLPLYCCSIEDIELLYNRISPISKEKQDQYIALWDKWSKSEAQLRIMDKNDVITEVNEDYSDKYILSHCSYEYERSVRVIGGTMGDLWDEGISLGDGFLQYRIIQLIKDGKLSVRASPNFNEEELNKMLDEGNPSGFHGEVIVNGVDVTCMRFFEIKLNENNKMTKNTLHVVSGYSAAKSMKLCFMNYGINDDVLMLDAAFNFAPLFQDISKETLDKRFQALKELFGDRDNRDYYREIQNFINYDFDRYERVVVWHGDDVDEQMLLYFTCSLVKVDIYDVDATYIKPSLPNKNTPRLNLSCLRTEDIKLLYDKISPIPKDKQDEYIALWDKWSKSEAQLRIMDKNNVIIEVEANYPDKYILSRCSYEYESETRATGPANMDLQKEGILLGYKFLDYRVIHLIKEGRLSVRANPDPKFSENIEHSTQNDKHKIIVNGVNVTWSQFFEIKLNEDNKTSDI